MGKVIALGGILHTILLMPPVFVRLFSMSSYSAANSTAQWSLSGALLLMSIAALVLSARKVVAAAAALLGLLLVLDVELGSRIALKTMYTDDDLRPMEHLAQSCDAPFNVGHPFLHYVGLPWMHELNNLGFSDEDFVVEKPEGTVRIVCIGGSTTEEGYPEHLEAYLDGETGGTTRWEALNFGKGGWTSTHSMLNYILNGAEFSPDYVVIHHGWNDKTYLPSECQRWDGFVEFEVETYVPPGSLERVLIRSSALYRYLKFAGQSPDRERVVPYAESKDQQHPELCRDEDPLWVFRRNTENVVDLSLARSIVPVLTTQPRHPLRAQEEEGLDAHFVRCNEVMRQLHGEAPTTTLFADLDQTMTGPREYFLDVAHCTPAGLAMKAQEIGEVILEHWQDNRRQVTEEAPATEGSP